MMNGEKKINLSLSLEPSEWEQIDGIAKVNNLSKEEMIERIVSHGLHLFKQKKNSDLLQIWQSTLINLITNHTPYDVGTSYLVIGILEHCKSTLVREVIRQCQEANEGNHDLNMSDYLKPGFD